MKICYAICNYLFIVISVCNSIAELSTWCPAISIQFIITFHLLPYPVINFDLPLCEELYGGELL